ncbi:MAG: alcohol dehydrogenase catalytic domain-containing protein [Chloroflexi bacterium]|nr:alcohol dehydrogenase catalytic domain-containing protein [Chloroflexota bacterium]
MKALALVPGSTELKLVDRPEPQITAADEVKVRIVRVGICGTDREEASGGRAKAPPGQTELVIGHEMFSQVVAVGSGVTRVKVGDYAVFTVRRGCGKCTPCRMNRSDMCETGEFSERGIWGADGYQTEYVVDKEMYITRVPAELEPIGILTEPLAVAEKAIAEAVALQTTRLPDAAVTPDWLFGKRCLVAGLGPIGLLAAVILALAGAELYGMDIVDENTVRPEWFKHIGGRYIDGRVVTADNIDDKVAEMDLIFEATGVASVEFNLLDALAYNGIYVLTGIPGGDRPIQFDAADLIRQLVLKNQALVGSVNDAQGHFQMAVNDLARAQLRWPGHLQKLITDRHPADDFQNALTHHDADEIKVVIEWGDPVNA